MNIVDEVRKEREDLARVLKKHAGIRKIVEDLYPDSAHFIYELLQNAEDTGATEAKFHLSNDNLVFEHNGRPFDPKDIFAITDIGEGTKAGDDDKIGRFGVGFKAVFAYSETPHIWSSTYCFKIDELVLPYSLETIPEIGALTRFKFPFNNPKKDKELAYQEVSAGLDELAETTLLFLTHLESIVWKINGETQGEVLRIQHSQNHIEVLKQKDGKVTTSLHFLKFEQPVVGLEKQKIAIAFALEFLPDIGKFDASKQLNKQLKIVSATPGRVSVFFPAEKETSGLRFHLHAPFVPELSRASIKETPSNIPLFNQLGSLAGKSLHEIKKLGLLKLDFLGVLPNSQDSIPARYSVIRSEIINEMNNKHLTPTHTKSYFPAQHLLQARASLKSLLSEEDIKFLVDYEDVSPKWSVGAIKGSNAEKFLESLKIKQWDLDQFYEMLSNKTHAVFCVPNTRPLNITPEQVHSWLSGKESVWLQQFYAILYEYVQLNSVDWQKLQVVSKLTKLRIIKCLDGEFRTGSECFFPDDTIETESSLPVVDKAVFSSGKSKIQQENSRKFMDTVGVKEISESDLVEVLLKERYKADNFLPKIKDIKRFVLMLENNPNKASVFEKYFIFKLDTEKWGMPSQVYIDEPYSTTGLRSYYEVMNNIDVYALSKEYLKCGIDIKKIINFAKIVGCQFTLNISETNCLRNPDWEYLRRVPGERHTSPINTDYTILGLRNLLSTPTIQVSKLIWDTMCLLPSRSKYFRATYQKNEANGARYADSQLIHILRNTAWVPQQNVFTKPAAASRELLPAGFPYDSGWQWLKAIHFEEDVVKKTEENLYKFEIAKKNGFGDLATFERAQRFAQLPKDEQESILSQHEHHKQPELPEAAVNNPERRRQRMIDDSANAPDKESVRRERSVQPWINEDVGKAKAYLRSLYVNSDDEMICQCCRQNMPFKVGELHYFEAIQCIKDLKKRSIENRLALCPNCAAKFLYIRNTDDQELLNRIVNLVEPDTSPAVEITISLANKEYKFHFVGKHWFDLKTILENM